MRSGQLLLAFAFTARLLAQDGTYELAYTPPGTVGQAVYVDGAVSADGSVALITTDNDTADQQFALARFHVDGSLDWCRLIGLAGALDTIAPRKVIFTSGGDLLCFGVHRIAGIDNYFLSRLTAEGDPVWSRSYPPGLDENLGDYGFSSMHPTTDDGAFVNMGTTARNIVMRVDANGDVVWAHGYVTSESPTLKNPGFDFATLPDGGLFITGKAEGAMFLVRTDGDGQLAWSKRYENGMYSHAKCAIALSEGGYLISGFAYLSPFVMRLNAAGDMMWARTYPTAPGAMAGLDQSIELPDGTFLVTPLEDAALLGLHLDADGMPLNGYLLPGYPSNADLIGSHNGRILLSGRVSQHYFEDLSIYGTTVPLMRINSSLDMYCAYANNEATSYDAPAVTPTSGCTVTDEVVVPAELGFYCVPATASVGPMCAGVYVAETSMDHAGISASPTMVPSGGAVNIDTGSARTTGHVEHILVDGRIDGIRPFSPDKKIEFSTAGWPPGVHTFRAFTTDRRFIGATRVVVY